MISMTWVLVLLLGGAGDYRNPPVMNTLPDFTTEEQCKLAGEAWKIAATEAKERSPRYVCFVTETRLE